MANKLFRGFSTVTSASGRKKRDRTLYDLDLIKSDLLNHFYTRPGERSMRPDWGCLIWQWLMDPMTEGLKNRIANEAIRVCQADSRITVVEVQVTSGEHSVQVDMVLNFDPLSVIDTFSINFEQREVARWNT